MMTAVTPMLRLRNVCAWYGHAQALIDVSLEVHRGEVVALVGPNGAGKSTLLKSTMGLIEKRRGVVEWMGQDISQQATHQRARAGLAYVPEDRRIFTELSVEENLACGQQPVRHWPDGRIAPQWTSDALYALFPSLYPLRKRLGAHMSGGEQQMLTIARTLMGNPLMVLLDEPSEGVAPLVARQLAAMINTLKAQGLSVLLSEQNAYFAQSVCDRSYYVVNGALTASLSTPTTP